jgi:hypothetical protein
VKYELSNLEAKRIFEEKGWPWSEQFLSATITPLKRRQTSSQRGYYWASLQAFGSSLGYTARESEVWLHNAVKCEAFGVKQKRHIGRSVVEVPKKRSSEAARDEYSELIETLIYLAAEAGYVVEPAHANI